MRFRMAFWILLSLAFLLALWATPASAGLDTWYFGGSFNIGGVFFRVGFAEAGPFGSSFYFEAAQPFSYRGYGCSSYCYRRGPRYYHHPSCSAVHHHFSHHGYAPAYFIEHYGPPLPYPPPVHYYDAPRWNVHFYGYYPRHDRYYRDRHHRDRHHRDRYYRDRHYRDRYYRDKHHRYKSDRSHKGRYRDDRYRDDRRSYDRHRDKGDHNRSHRDRRRDDRDRHNGGRFDQD